MTDVDVVKPSVVRELMVRHQFSLKKQFGQNFLVDRHVLEQIVDAAEIKQADGVLEIGPGAGVVTQQLAVLAKQVIAIDKDRSLQSVLAETLAEFNNVDLIFADVLQLNMEEVWRGFDACDRVSVVANLPYYITTPILFHLLESEIKIANIVIMVQKEVADRLCALPGTKDYGALTVAVQYRGLVERIVRVKPNSFMPPPNVESTVVRIQATEEPRVTVKDETTFFRVVRAAFAQRRKTLLNALSGQLGLAKGQCDTILEEVCIDGKRRGETLTIEEFAALANRLAESR